MAVVAALLSVAAPVRSQSLPPFIEQVRAAIVWAPAVGVLVGDDLAVTHGHDLSRLQAGDSVRVTLLGYAQVTGRISPAGLVPPDPDINLPGVVLCWSRDADARWVRLTSPLPEGIRPLRISRAFIHPLYVVRLRSAHPAVYVGERLTVVGRSSKHPVVEVQDGSFPGPGWSGSPVVNARGELVGLVSGGGGSDTAIGLNLLWPCPTPRSG